MRSHLKRLLICAVLLAPAAVWLPSPSHAQDTQFHADDKIIVRAEKLSRGFDVCARSMGPKLLGSVVVELAFMDNFDTILDRQGVLLLWQENRGMLCYQGPATRLRDFSKWVIFNVSYQLRESTR